ncbi:LOW QUALITY PROTEIN: hypothetical protein BSKO_09132 [Bryopsis sp. KO-2023]|nr:LOW QUALITY PROTEIN: hypothetical protein BSKO_09132 [Bryopsis sp. KO-2023]
MDRSGECVGRRVVGKVEKRNPLARKLVVVSKSELNCALQCREVERRVLQAQLWKKGGIRQEPVEILLGSWCAFLWFKKRRSVYCISMGKSSDRRKSAAMFSREFYPSAGLKDGDAISLWQEDMDGPLGVRQREDEMGQIIYSVVKLPIAAEPAVVEECLFHVMQKFEEGEFALRSEACGGCFLGVQNGKLRLVRKYYPWRIEEIPEEPWEQAMMIMVAACGKRGLELTLRREGFYTGGRLSTTMSDTSRSQSIRKIDEGVNALLESHGSNMAEAFTKDPNADDFNSSKGDPAGEGTGDDPHRHHQSMSLSPFASGFRKGSSLDSGAPGAGDRRSRGWMPSYDAFVDHVPNGKRRNSRKFKSSSQGEVRREDDNGEISSARESRSQQAGGVDGESRHQLEGMGLAAENKMLEAENRLLRDKIGSIEEEVCRLKVAMEGQKGGVKRLVFGFMIGLSATITMLKMR